MQMESCPNVLTDKLHPQFLKKILSKMVWIICQCLWYYGDTSLNLKHYFVGVLSIP